MTFSIISGKYWNFWKMKANLGPEVDVLENNSRSGKSQAQKKRRRWESMNFVLSEMDWIYGIGDGLLLCIHCSAWRFSVMTYFRYDLALFIMSVHRSFNGNSSVWFSCDAIHERRFSWSTNIVGNSPFNLAFDHVMKSMCILLTSVWRFMSRKVPNTDRKVMGLHTLYSI